MTLEQGEQQSEEYVESRGFGPPIRFGPRSGPTTKVNFRPWLHKITIKVGGPEVFSSQRTVGAPSSISAQAGKTTQQIVNEKVKPSSQFFVEARLPREVVKPEYRQGFGTSRVTADGLQ